MIRLVPATEVLGAVVRVVWLQCVRGPETWSTYRGAILPTSALREDDRSGAGSRYAFVIQGSSAEMCSTLTGLSSGMDPLVQKGALQ